MAATNCRELLDCGDGFRGVAALSSWPKSSPMNPELEVLLQALVHPCPRSSPLRSTRLEWVAGCASRPDPAHNRGGRGRLDPTRSQLLPRLFHRGDQLSSAALGQATLHYLQKAFLLVVRKRFDGFQSGRVCVHGCNDSVCAWECQLLKPAEKVPFRPSGGWRGRTAFVDFIHGNSLSAKVQLQAGRRVEC